MIKNLIDKYVEKGIAVEIFFEKHGFRAEQYSLFSRYSVKDGYGWYGVSEYLLKDGDIILWRDDLEGRNRLRAIYGMSIEDLADDISQLPGIPKIVMDEMRLGDAGHTVKTFMHWLWENSLAQIEKLPINEFTFASRPGSGEFSEKEYVAIYDKSYSETLKNIIICTTGNAEIYTIDANNNEDIKFEYDKPVHFCKNT